MFSRMPTALKQVCSKSMTPFLPIAEQFTAEAAVSPTMVAPVQPLDPLYTNLERETT